MDSKPNPSPHALEACPSLKSNGQQESTTRVTLPRLLFPVSTPWQQLDTRDYACVPELHKRMLQSEGSMLLALVVEMPLLS
jgi:hypothetical protein